MAATYDYPPELYQSYTDRMMTYSSGWWDGKDVSIEGAQNDKYNRAPIVREVGAIPVSGGIW